MTQADVLIQAGHSADFPPHIPNGGGAPHEAEWTARAATALQASLLALPTPVACDIVGSWLSYNSSTKTWTTHPPPPNVKFPYKLAIFLHYDADLSLLRPGYNTGWFWDRWENETLPQDADRFGSILEATYAARLPQIPFHPERRNVNTSLYYAEPSIVYAPAVLVECCVGQGLDKPIAFDNDPPYIIPETLAEAVAAYLGVPYTSPTLPSIPTDPCTSYIEALRLANWRKFEFERYVREPTHRTETDEQAQNEGIAPIDLMLRWAQDHFNAGDPDPTS